MTGCPKILQVLKLSLISEKEDDDSVGEGQKPNEKRPKN